MAVTLRLSGSIVQMLADNNHLDPSGPERLDRAAAAWRQGASRRRTGGGWLYIGKLPAADASLILNYVDSVAGLLLGGDTDARAEGRVYARGLASAVRALRQEGAPVIETRWAYGVDYTVREPFLAES